MKCSKCPNDAAQGLRFCTTCIGEMFIIEARLSYKAGRILATLGKENNEATQNATSGPHSTQSLLGSAAYG
jgi:hypothetical protein